jgi:hypothetical protein
MQPHPKALTRRDFFRLLAPGWLQWQRMKALVYAVAIISVVSIGVSMVLELGFTNTIKSAGGFFTLLFLAYLGSRASDIAQGIFKRCPKSVRAFLCALGRFSSYLAFGFCGIHIYEQWRAAGDISQVILPLLVFFAFQFRDEWEKQR